MFWRACCLKCCLKAINKNINRVNYDYNNKIENSNLDKVI